MIIEIYKGADLEQRFFNVIYIGLDHLGYFHIKTQKAGQDCEQIRFRGSEFSEARVINTPISGECEDVKPF